MTRDDIIRMAREAGMFKLFGDQNGPEALTGKSIERFAKLVYEMAWADTALAATHTVTDAAIALEREACAKLAESKASVGNASNYPTYIAAAIRARSNP